MPEAAFSTPVPDAMAKLSVVYPRVVQLAYRHSPAADPTAVYDPLPDREQLSPEQVFASFYARQNETALPDADLDYIRTLLTEEGDALCGR